MAFKLKSGNSPQFRSVGSSPAKITLKRGSTTLNPKGVRMEDNDLGAKNRVIKSTAPEVERTPKTNQEIKQYAKTAKQKARGSKTDGGKRLTKGEKRTIKANKLAQQGKRAQRLEASGEGEKSFGWKEAGMALLEGKGLVGGLMAGIGTGDDKSVGIANKQARIAGDDERRRIKDNQKTEIAAKKAAKLAQKKSQSDKITATSNLETDA